MAELLKETRLLTKEHFTTLYMSDDERENYGTKTGEDALQDKVVGFFFSAAWCPPCQHFVPALREVYDELVQREEAFEIVFVSMDRSQEEMMDYYKEKHGKWLALKYGDPEKECVLQRNVRDQDSKELHLFCYWGTEIVVLRAKTEILEKNHEWNLPRWFSPCAQVAGHRMKNLVEKFRISLIPKLVIVRPDGEVITTKGRKDVQDKGLICFRGWHSAMVAATKKADQQQQQLLEQIEAEERAAAEASSS